VQVSDDYCTRVIDDLSVIGRARWDALVASDPHAGVFLRFDFLHALHDTGCAAPRAGWAPQFLTLWRGDLLVGAVPLYAKGNSYGEYVFDWGWAEAYQRHDMAYYPKWLAAVPFTPVGGSRLIAPTTPRARCWPTHWWPPCRRTSCHRCTCCSRHRRRSTCWLHVA
jgi:uncharacterized protein